MIIAHEQATTTRWLAEKLDLLVEK